MSQDHSPAPGPVPLVVQYLYIHEQGEEFYYPSVRAGATAADVAVRYLECALAQAATIHLRNVPCGLVLATNIGAGRVSRSASKLLKRLESLGVEILPTAYEHRPRGDDSTYISSRYVLDAILTATKGQPEDRKLWLTDLDCVWVDPQKTWAASPAAHQIGCVVIPYPADWDTVGFGEDGRTRNAIGAMAGEMGIPNDAPSWVGGELLAGTPGTLRTLVAACERLDLQLAHDGRFLPTEEQVLTLAGALGEIEFQDLSHVAQRVQTGHRHRATLTKDPLSLGLWHLPAEKGLSLRRTAQEINRGRPARLRTDLDDPVRMGRRFNVAGTGLTRRIRDDTWIATQRARTFLEAHAPRR